MPDQSTLPSGFPSGEGGSHRSSGSVELEQLRGEARGKEIHSFEFIALSAMLMAIAALGMDTMLVALPDIAQTFAVVKENDRQLVVTTYLLGMAAGQPLYGPLSDRFGRKPILAAGLVLFILGSLWAFLAPSFGAILAARALRVWGGLSPRAGDSDCPRSFFRSRHGQNDVV